MLPDVGMDVVKWDSRTEKTEVGRRKEQHITTTTSQCLRRCGDAGLTPCYVPCIPSSEKSKHGNQRQGSLTLHTIGACSKEWDSPTEVGGKRKE